MGWSQASIGIAELGNLPAAGIIMHLLLQGAADLIRN
jgi:hypothetical protein